MSHWKIISPFARHIEKMDIFHILLTVHLGTICVNNQLDTLF